MFDIISEILAATIRQGTPLLMDALGEIYVEPSGVINIFENASLEILRKESDKLKSDKKMLYINETIGHGTNLITGDYSVGASGRMIENGELLYPVSEITIAGNLNSIFQNIVLANDLELNYSTNSPTMLVTGMTVGGR